MPSFPLLMTNRDDVAREVSNISEYVEAVWDGFVPNGPPPARPRSATVAHLSDIDDAVGVDTGWYGIGEWLGFGVGLDPLVQVRRAGALVSVALVSNSDVTYDDLILTLTAVELPSGLQSAYGTVVVIPMVADDSSDIGQVVYSRSGNGDPGFQFPDFASSLPGGNDAYCYGQATYFTDDDPIDLTDYGTPVGGDGTGGHHGGR